MIRRILIVETGKLVDLDCPKIELQYYAHIKNYLS